ncbi:MAG: hypothetical protein Q7S52_02240 [bacterium]|nr:hypothetical protein [bacterium]
MVTLEAVPNEQRFDEGGEENVPAFEEPHSGERYALHEAFVPPFWPVHAHVYVSVFVVTPVAVPAEQRSAIGIGKLSYVAPFAPPQLPFMVGFPTVNSSETQLFTAPSADSATPSKLNAFHESVKTASTQK